MNGFPVFFLAGMSFVYQLPSLPSQALQCALLAILCAALRYRVWAAVALVAGVLWVSLTQAPAEIPELIAGQPGSVSLSVVGRIDSVPKVSSARTVFQLTIQEIDTKSVEPMRVRMAWYNNAPVLNKGDTWRMTVRLKPARGRYNGSGFDYERWLFSRRVVARGYVDARVEAELLPVPAPLLVRLQNGFRSHIASLLPAQSPGVLMALLAGDKSTLDPTLARAFRDSATAHVLVISGLHITLIAGLGYALGGLIWRLLRLRSISRQRFSLLVGFGAASFYALLAGFTLPVTRAWLMLSVWVVCGIMQRHIRAMTKLQIALLLVLLIDPRAPLDTGFWLSFYAVAVILLMLPLDRYLPSWLLLFPWQWRMTLLTLPMMALVFGQFSPVSVIANLLVVPVFSLLLVPGGFLGAALGAIWPAAGGWLLHELTLAVRGVTHWLICLVNLPGVIWLSPALNLPTAIVAFVGAAVVLLPRQLRWWPLLPVFFLGLFFTRVQVPPEGRAEVTVMDVGQGLSVLVQTRQHSLIYDTGAWLGRDLTVARGLIVPALQSRGLRELDTLLVSHPDSDHAAGYEDLLTDLPIRQVIANPAFRRELRRIDTPCEDGHEWVWDGVVFRLLLASLDSDASDNDRSCVLEINANGERLLLTGDIEREAERALLDKGSLRPARYLVAPHHGSQSSSTERFISAVTPRHVIYTVGYRNRWHFPSQDVVARYESHGVRHWRTDRDGCIQIHLGRRELTAISACRDAHVRFWRPPFDL